jgi:hypothetical protein
MDWVFQILAGVPIGFICAKLDAWLTYDVRVRWNSKWVTVPVFIVLCLAVACVTITVEVR